MVVPMEEIEREIIEIAKELIPLKAISPESGGEGESDRAKYLSSKLKEWKIRHKLYTYRDKSGILRPNIVASAGKRGETITVVAHTDTVVAGDLNEWKTNPFSAVVKNRRIYGRGTEDNGTGIIAGLLALKSISGSDHDYNIKLVLAADEEVGSEYGVQALIKNGVLTSDRMFLVPDWGTKTGSDIEVAEKGRLWLRFTIKGKQTHASTPDRGLNAAKLGSRLALAIDADLHKRFGARNPIFDPTASTFEITKREANVESINIIPGKDVFYMDMRILPEYEPDRVLKAVSNLIIKSKMDVKLDVIEKSDPSKIGEKSRMLPMLSESIRQVLGVSPKKVGIGGGTVAAYLRQAGKDAVVWGIEDGMAHEPNEYVSIDNIIKSVRVIEHLFR